MKTQLFSGIMQDHTPEWGTVRFHCRFQKNVFEYYKNRPKGTSKAIRYCLQRFKRSIMGGEFKVSMPSSFLLRPDISDKVELYVSMTVTDKDMLEKLSFAVHISQAEVLRLVLEWYMAIGFKDEIHGCHTSPLIKRHHRRPVISPCSLRFKFWTYGRVLEWTFPARTSIENALKPHRPPRARQKQGNFRF